MIKTQTTIPVSGSKYKHLFFDLDHTLWDFDTNAKETLLEVYDEFTLHEKGIENFNDFYVHYLHHNKILWDKYHHKLITADDLKWKRIWRTLLEFKIGDEELAKKMASRFLEILPIKKNLFLHTKEVLNYLLNKNYVLHLITNGFEKTQFSKLKNSQLDHYFTHVITSEASDSVKPQKEIFEYAMQKAGASLTESIMLGDNLDADILGAMNVGMDTVFVNHINATTNLQPTYIVENLLELKNIF